MTSPSAPTREARRFVRLDTSDRLTGLVLGLGVRLDVRDLSLGGLSALTATPLDVDAVHAIQVKHRDRRTRVTTVHARVTHCGRVDPSSPRPAYVVGFAFEGTARPDGPTVEELIDQITSASLSFV